MTTVVKVARSTNAGINSSRLKIDMGDLYKLEDNQGALFVTASQLGKRPAQQYQVKWMTKELRPKFDTTAANATNVATTIQVTDPSYFQVNDLVLVPSTGELFMVTGPANAATSPLTVIRGWGSTAAAAIGNGADLEILGAHYPENATLQAARSTTEVLFVNQTALWRTNLEESGTLQAIGDQGGTYFGPDIDTEREDMLLVHKRDINLACIESQLGGVGNQRSISGFKEFVTVNGTNRVNNTSAVTWSVFSNAMRTAFRFNNGKLLFIVSTLGAQIISEWVTNTSALGNATIYMDPGAKMFGLQIMEVVTPHGMVRILVDNALEGTYGSRFWLGVCVDKKGGPKWRYLRDTRILKNRQTPDQDGYKEEVLTEGTIEWTNPNYHYLFSNAQTSS